MELSKSFIESFIQKEIVNNPIYLLKNFETNLINHFNQLFDVKDSEISKKYMINNIVNSVVTKLNKDQMTIYQRKKKLHKLKQLKLPEQRSPEWYAMRETMVTASSLASVIGKGHFTTRDELLLSKIISQPYTPNPITEWGVKYEDVAIQFYEELNSTKVLDFGLIPHTEFPIFGASPDGICDDVGNDEFVGRMVEIKCPPKRKFTKTVPPHYLMQCLGQLEVCDLDECDFFQVKIEEYENEEEYLKDAFEIDGIVQHGRTHLNYPKGVTITYKNLQEEGKFIYRYCELNKSYEDYKQWISSQPSENLHEVKWWKITRYEQTLVLRDRDWWTCILDKIQAFYDDMLFYKNPENTNILQNRVNESKKRKRKTEVKPLPEHLLVSSDEEDQ
jgi:putative phage-type endonuclease